MKKVILITIMTLLSVNVLFSQARAPKGLFEIEWGDSFEKAESILVSRQYKISKAIEGEYLLAIGLWADNYVQAKLLFKNDRFNFFSLLILNNKLYNTYNLIANDLKKAYGKEYYSIKNVEPPYSIGDGKEDEAIYYNKISLLSIWSLMDCLIILEIDKDDKLVTISYSYNGEKVISKDY